jgi:hypothetical protein
VNARTSLGLRFNAAFTGRMTSRGATRGRQPRAATRSAVRSAPGAARVIQTVRALAKVDRDAGRVPDGAGTYGDVQNHGLGLKERGRSRNGGLCAVENQRERTIDLSSTRRPSPNRAGHRDQLR